ncbi:MAG: DUF4202 domain-containing protein [Rhodobacteraceae bacterium]|nr:DUF4202 domain-containing protein [Paracoccaceae bacterium]
MTRLTATLSAIDAANEADPDRSEGSPAARLYGERMTAELLRILPDASDELRIAARGQHIERWKTPRSAYPDGREGYLTWRRDLGGFHARRVGEIMAENGYGQPAIDHVGRMIRKEGIKRDADVQLLEDVICFTFLRWYFHPFADGRSDESLTHIVARTARKMSAGARQRALAEFDLPEFLAEAVRSAGA